MPGTELDLSCTLRFTDPPDGPVALWMIVLSDTGELMGAEPITGPLAWVWRDGALNLSYPVVRVVVRRPGVAATGIIAAVNPGAGAVSPQFEVGLFGGTARDRPLPQVRYGDVLMVSEGLFRLDT